jgi:hypothetical protein
MYMTILQASHITYAGTEKLDTSGNAPDLIREVAGSYFDPGADYLA